MGGITQSPQQYDVLLIYDENDAPDEDDTTEGSDAINRTGRQVNAPKGVKAFKKILEQHVKMSREEEGRLPKVASLHIDLVGMGTANNQLKEGIERSTYLFFYLSPSFSDAEKEKTVKEIQKMKDDALHETMHDKSKENCAIPIYTLSRKESRERNFSVPFGLRSIRGIDISCIIKDGTPLDQIENIESLDESKINYDVIEKLEKLLNRKAEDMKKREDQEEQELGKHRVNGERTNYCNRLGNPGSSESEDSFAAGDIPHGKTANGGMVAEEVGQDSAVDSSRSGLSDAGRPVTAVSDSSSNFSSQSSSTQVTSGSSLDSFPPVIFPPQSQNAVQTSPQPNVHMTEMSSMPELNLSEHDSPPTTGQNAQLGGSSAPNVGLLSLASLNNMISSQRSGALSPESPSSSFMDLQETEFIPGINMHTLRLSSEALAKLMRKQLGREGEPAP